MNSIEKRMKFYNDSSSYGNVDQVVYYHAKAGLLQWKMGNEDDAKERLALAKNILGTTETNVDVLFKISKLSIILERDNLPNEISLIEDLLTKSISMETSQYAIGCARLAKLYFSFNADKGNFYLNEALNWGIYTHNDTNEAKVDLNFKLAKAYKASNQTEKCLKLVKELEVHASTIQNTTKKAKYYLKLINIVLTIDKEYGKNLISTTAKIIFDLKNITLDEALHRLHLFVQY